MGVKIDEQQMVIILRAIDETRAAFDSMNKRAKKSGNLLKEIFKKGEMAVFAFEAAVLGAGVYATKKMIDMTVNLAKSAVQTADNFEKLRIQIQTLKGSAEAGDRVFSQLWDIAKKIPFTIDEIAGSAKRLQAFGVLGEDVEEAIVGVADAAAAAGVSMDMMATVMGRAWRQGNFLTRGPGAIFKGIMQTKMGIDDITKLSLPEFQKAVARMLTDPQFGIAGMSKKLATTWTGIQSMISDSLTIIKLEIANAGIFEEVKKVGEDIRDFLRSEDVVSRIKRIGEIIGNVVASFRKKFNEMIATGKINELLDDWIDNVQRWADTAGTIIANLPAIAQTVMNMVSSMSMAFQKLFQLMGKLFQGLAALGLADSVEDEASRTHKALIKINQDISSTRAKLEGGVGSSVDPAYQSELDYLDKMGLTERAAELRKIIAREQAESISLRKEEVAALKNQLVYQEKLQASAQAKFDQINNLKKLLSGEADFSFADLFNGKPGEKAPDKTVTDTDTNVKGLNATLGDTNSAMQELNDSWNFNAEKVLTIKERFQEMLEEYKKAGGVMMDIWKAAADTVQTVFFDVMEGELANLEDMFRSFSSAINQIIAQQASLKLIAAFAPGPAAAAGTGDMGFNPATGEMEGLAFGGPVGGRAGRDLVPKMLTKGEIVLTGRDQQNLYQMIREGGGGKAAGPTTNNYISAMDPTSFYDFLQRNQDAIVGAMGGIRRDGVRGYRG